MRQLILYVVIAAAALAAGIMVTLFGVRPRITKLNAQLTEQVSKNKEMETISQQHARAAGAEIARLNSEITRTRAELEQLKATLLQQQQQQQSDTSAEQAPSEQPVVEPSKDTASEKSTAAVPDVSTRLYKVKEGDSLWKVAADQLGSGSRYKEIIRLNPGIPVDDLKVGMELKIPAK